MSAHHSLMGDSLGILVLVVVVAVIVFILVLLSTPQVLISTKSYELISVYPTQTLCL